VQKALLVALGVAEADPTGHRVHELLPARLYVPAGHAAHLELLVASL
jgi:hypothetical protein